MLIKTKLKMSSLGATVLIMVLANTVLFPILPAMRDVLNLSLVQASLLIVAVNVPAAIFSPVGGILSDLWGRKAVIIPSLLIYGAGGLLAGLSGIFAENPYVLIFTARIAQGIGSAAPMFLAITLAGDIFQSTERSKAVGIMEAFSGIGKIAGPILGSVVGALAWYSPFFIYPLVSVPTAVAVYFLIDEKSPTRLSVKEYLSVTEVFKKKVNIIGLVTSFFSLFVLFGLMFWLSETIESKLDTGALLRGIIISMPVVAFMLTTLFAEWFYVKFKLKKTILMGLAFVIIFVALVPLIYRSLFIWPSVFLAGVGIGIVMPALDSLFTGLMSASHRGIITTLFGSIRSLGVAAGTYSFAQLMPFGTGLTLWVTAALVLAAAASVFFLFDEKDIPEREENVD